MFDKLIEEYKKAQDNGLISIMLDRGTPCILLNNKNFELLQDGRLTGYIYKENVHVYFYEGGVEYSTLYRLEEVAYD